MWDLDQSSAPNFKRLYQLAQQEQSILERRRRIRAADRQYAVYTDSIQRRHLTWLDGDGLIEEVQHAEMRLLPACVYNHYTTFALRPHSPYRKFLDEQIIK